MHIKETNLLRSSRRFLCAVCVSAFVLASGCGLGDLATRPDASDDAGDHDAGHRDARDRDSTLSGDDANTESDAAQDAFIDSGIDYVQSYLSDSSWVLHTVANGWGPIERDAANGDTGVGDGAYPLTIGGTQYLRGLGVHAHSDVRVVLNGNCTSFSAWAGIDDSSLGGDVFFEVWLDGVKWFQSDVIESGDRAISVEVPLRGKNEMHIIAATQDDIVGDEADWGNARMTCAEGWHGGEEKK